MALQDILQKLRSDTEAEIAQITLACESDCAEVLKKNELYFVNRTHAATVDCERRASKVAERILSKARHQATFIETAAVQADLELVFLTLQQQLLELPPADYSNYLEARFASLPSLNEAMYQVASERAEVTTEFLVKKGIATSAIQPTSGLLGGFIVATDDREYDFSFTGLLKKIRTEQSVEISKQVSA
jgi:vacuolar-type H+-ATPase subunit E/Vma4